MAKRHVGRPSNAERERELIAKTTREVLARYDAAGMGRRMRGWMPPQTGPNRAAVGNERIRARSHDSIRNDWPSASGVQKWATSLIGVGIQCRELPTVPTVRRASRSTLWTEFMRDCDADGIFDGYGQQTLGVRSWFGGGEYFLRRRPRRSDSPLTVPVQIQMLESEMLPDFNIDATPFMPKGNKIRRGIEFNTIGQRVAYWFYKEHPGDGGFGSSRAGFAGIFAGAGSVDPSQLVRVSASDIAHVFEPKRIGELRGVSELASILTRLRGDIDFDDAVSERQKLANLYVGFITRTLPVGVDGNINPETGMPYETEGFGAEEKAMVGMEPGMMQELAPGEDIKFANPPEAGTTYSDYMRTRGLGTASGQGLPYELQSGDIINVSDRTLRILVNEFRRHAEQRQWQVIIPMHCQPVRNWFVDAAVLAGEIPITFGAEAKSVSWVPHGWPYIHPVQDAQGKALEVQSGARSRSSWITERGDDPETVDNERKADIDRETKLGIPIAEIKAPASTGNSSNQDDQQQQP